MKLSTYITERPAVMPTVAPVGALRAVCPPPASATAGYGHSVHQGIAFADRQVFTSGNARKPLMHKDWTNRSRQVGITTSLRSARHLGSPPT